MFRNAFVFAKKGKDVIKHTKRLQQIFDQLEIRR